jgi:hypothetical protein
MSLFRVVIFVGFLAVLGSGSDSGGRVVSAPSSLWASPLQLTNPAADRGAEIQRSKMLNAREKKQLLADADRLIQMSTLLKQQIDRQGSGSLSADAIKNAGDIEKLAHSVKKGLGQMPYSAYGPK